MQKLCNLDDKAGGNPNKCVVPGQNLAIFGLADIGAKYNRMPPPDTR